MTPLALGIDIGGTKVLIGLVSQTGQVLRTWRTPTMAERGGPAVMADVVEAVASAIASLAPEERRALVGLGVSAAGQIDAEAGVVAYASPNIPGWTGTPIRSVLTARFGLPVAVDNDANAAALGEWWAGAGQGVDSLVMITVGTGVGGGVVQGGRVLRGGRYRGGELGHMIIQAEGVRCNCGQPGCLEVYASGTAIGRMAREAIPGFAGGAPEVFAAAEAGDAAAEAVLRRSARFLACGLVSIGSLLDADRYLLGGGVATQPRYLGLVHEALMDPAVSGERGFDTGIVRLAGLSEAAGVVGAAAAVFL